jgi:hypothetical protein
MHAATICEALQQRRMLRFRYKDRSTNTVVEPYLYGENTAGHTVISAWLVTGETHDTKAPYWRQYFVKEMQWVELLPDRFESNRPGYNANDPHFRTIECRVADRLPDTSSPAHA